MGPVNEAKQKSDFQEKAGGSGKKKKRLGYRPPGEHLAEICARGKGVCSERHREAQQFSNPSSLGMFRVSRYTERCNNFLIPLVWECPGLRPKQTNKNFTLVRVIT